MPLIYKVPFNNFIAKIPFIRNVFLPKITFLPAYKLHSLGNFINDEYNLISMSQITDMYNHLMLNSDDFVYLLNKNQNAVLFYAKDEAFNTIPQYILDEIYNKEYVTGLHESFRATRILSADFL